MPKAKAAKPAANPAWTLERNSRNVFTIKMAFDTAKWEQWILLRSDVHHDNPHCDQRLEKRHLDQAVERNAIIIDNGDLFCAMQGKYDKRSSKDAVRPEHQGSNYLDSPVMAGCWLYLPRKHKTENSKHHRAIPIPQSIQAVLRPYLDRDAESYCFSPREQEQRRGRPLRSGARAFRDHFDTQSYTRSIQNACRRANIKPWTANQIRHLGIFEMAASHGARAAMLFAGHSNLTTTSRYLAFDAATLFGAVKDR